MLASTEIKMRPKNAYRIVLIITLLALFAVTYIAFNLAAAFVAKPKEVTCVITLVDRVGVKHEYEGRIKPSLDN